MKKLLIALLAASNTIPAQAAVIHYTLQNASLTDGSSVTGSFDYNETAIIDKFTNLNITTKGSTFFGVAEASNYYAFAQTSSAYDAYIQIYFDAPMGNLNGGGTFSVNASGNSYFFGETPDLLYFAEGGTITSAAADVPEPAMLGLFGLGAIGLRLSRRRTSVSA